MPTLSLITCTRDPDPAHLRRVLVGIEALRVPAGYDREFLLVDSASAHPLAERAEEKVFVAREPWARIVRANEPGLSVARRLGVAESKGDLLVWFDDDNVPEPDYLEQVVATATAHPDVSVWGAGTIVVEFTDPVAPWVERNMRPFFQERAHGHDEFGADRQWAPYFPFGSGLVTRRAAIARWAEASATGRYSRTDRAGAAFSAGDDAQIIFGAIAAGERVGVAARQALKHLILPKRGTEEALARREFGIAAAQRLARAECFPDDPEAQRTDDVSLIEAAMAALAELPAHGVIDGPRHAHWELARRLGALAGALQRQRRPEPEWFRAAVAMLGLR